MPPSPAMTSVENAASPVVASAGAPFVQPQDVSIQVRTYQPADNKAVGELFAAGMLFYAKNEGHLEQLWMDYVEQSIASDLADIQGTYFGSGGHFWVATAVEHGEQVIVGIVGLEGKGDGEAELRRMSVKAEYRRYGVGRLLIAQLELWAREAALKKVWLSTGGVMLQARRFYESIGYTQYKTEVVSEDPYFEAVFFEKLLA